MLQHHLPRACRAVTYSSPPTCAGEKPEAVRTHLRDALIVPEMIGSVIGVYNGKTFNQARLSRSCAGGFGACPTARSLVFLITYADAKFSWAQHRPHSTHKPGYLLSSSLHIPLLPSLRLGRSNNPLASSCAGVLRPALILWRRCRSRSSRTWWARTWRSTLSRTSPSSTVRAVIAGSGAKRYTRACRAQQLRDNVIKHEPIRKAWPRSA